MWAIKNMSENLKLSRRNGHDVPLVEGAVILERRYFAGYIIVACALMMLIVLLQSLKYRLFGRTLLLGWDTPSYVWMAKYTIAKSPINMIGAWGYPYFYTFVLRIPSDTSMW